MGFSPAYRAFVAAHPAATVWHDADFLECLTAHESIHDWSAAELIVDGVLVGVLPICTKKRVDGHVITTPPLARYCSPLFRSAYLRSVGEKRAICALIDCLPKGYVSLDQQWHPTLYESTLEANCVQTKELPTYKIELPKSLEEVIMLPRKKMRKSLRQAAEYWTLTQGKVNAEVLGLLKSPFHRQQLEVPFDDQPILSAFEYLESKEQAVCHFAHDPNGELQGATICLADNHAAYCWIAGSSEEARPYSCGSFLLATEVRWAFERGLQEVDFLGSALPGPAENRRHLGGTKHLYPHVYTDKTLLTKGIRSWRMR